LCIKEKDIDILSIKMTDANVEPNVQIVESVVPDVSPAEERAETAEATPQPVQSLPSATIKKRGRPPGAKNKPKIVELTESVKSVKESVKESVNSAESVERREPPAEKVFTQSQVRQLLVETFRMHEQEHRDNKRQRYEQLFRKR
jgi:hypothetical protein